MSATYQVPGVGQFDARLDVVEGRRRVLGEFSSLTTGVPVFAGELVVNANALNERLANGTIEAVFDQSLWKPVGDAATVASAGNLGASHTFDQQGRHVAHFQGTLDVIGGNAHTITVSNQPAGSVADLLLYQSGNQTITVNGVSPTVPMTAGFFLVMVMGAPDGVTTPVWLPSAPGPPGASITGPAGAPGAPLVPRGTWNAATGYNRLDFVVYGRSSYVRLVGGLTATAPDADATNWGLIAQGGVDGIPSAGSVSFTSLDVTAQPPRMPTSGEETIDRINATATITLSSGALRYMYFRARRTEAITQLVLTSAGTAAAATPTIVRAGIYAVNPADWALSLLAAIPNDTSIFAAAGTEYQRYFGAALSAGLSTGAPITSLPVTAASMLVGLLAGATVTTRSGANTQTWVLTADAAAGATSLAVASQTPNFAYPSGSTVSGWSLNKVAGTWYAFAQLVVTAATAPTVPGDNLNNAIQSGSTFGRPRLAGLLSGQTDLPAAVAAPIPASANTVNVPYGMLVP